MPPATASAGPLSAAQLAAYDRDGFLVLSGLYPPDEMLHWKRVMKEVLQAEGNTAYVASGVRVWSAPEIHPVLKAAMHDAMILPVLLQVIGADVEFLSAKAVFKDSGTRFGSPWHQDWFYWEGSRKTSVWIALDDATPANGCLKFAPGTHVSVMPRVMVEENAFSNRVADKDMEGREVRTIEVKRGDAVVFSDLAAHSSFPNTTGADRWSLISTYRNAAEKDTAAINESTWKRPLLCAGRSVNAGEVF